MLPLEETPPRRIVSVPNLTAWLSLCILAAAWGRSLDDRWQPVWASMGAYGLVASVGLSALEKARRAHQRRLQDRAVRSRVECGLDKLHEQGATLDSVNAALRRLNSYVSRHPSTVSDKAGHPKRASQAQSLASLPLEIAPVVDNGEDDCELAGAIDGSIEKISSAGVSFLHAEPFVARVAPADVSLGRKAAAVVRRRRAVDRGDRRGIHDRRHGAGRGRSGRPGGNGRHASRTGRSLFGLATARHRSDARRSRFCASCFALNGVARWRRVSCSRRAAAVRYQG